MPRFRLMEENVTRSIVFERSELLQLEEFAFSHKRSLSSVIREAVALYLSEVVNRRAPVNAHPDDGNNRPHSAP